MNVTPRTWLVTFMALVFMIGLSAGVLMDRTLLIPSGRGGGPGVARGGPIGLYGPLGPPPERYVTELQRQLALTDEQRDAILAILDERRPRIQQLQDEARERFVAEQQALFDAITAVLTPEQVEAFQQVTARQRGGPGRGQGRGQGRSGQGRGGQGQGRGR